MAADRSVRGGTMKIRGAGAFARSLLGSGLLYPLLLSLVVLGLFLTGAPTGEAFSWPDSPRHALNGAFVLDFVKAMPFAHPVAFAFDYYAKYPALTILFYPPLLYVFLAISYALFGVSQSSALIVEFVFYVALAIGTYRLARLWLAPMSAFGAALILAAAPEVAYWGRQVMLEIPTFAFVVWSAYFFLRYLRERSISLLYWAAALLVLAMYTKLTAAYVAIVYAVLLYRLHGRAVVRQRHYWIIALLGVLAVIPLVVLTLKFGQANIQSAGGVPDARVSRATIAGWLWYARKMPSQLGWPALLSAVAGLVYVLSRRERIGTFLPLLLWLAVGYLFFSAIDLKEARHSLSLLPPLCILAALGITAIAARVPRLAGPGIVLIGLATLYLTAFTRPVEYVAGYKDVANYIAQIAPKDSVVAFSGYRDGAFIFAMRTHEERRDLSIVRTDKLLLKIAVKRSLGVKQIPMNESRIASALDAMGAQYVVAQPGFWTDLDVMQRLENVLHSSHFRPVREFAMQANYPAQEKSLIVYRNLAHVAKGPIRLNIAIPMIGKSISGMVGK